MQSEADLFFASLRQDLRLPRHTQALPLAGSLDRYSSDFIGHEFFSGAAQDLFTSL